MSPRQRAIEHEPDRHRRQTEWRMVFGGFALIALIGGLLLWLRWGLTVALIGLGIVVGAIAIFALLLVLLRIMEAWARSE